MTDKLINLIPELEWIKDADLRQAAVASYVDALSHGGWKPVDMGSIPFTLLAETGDVSYLTHVRAVTQMCRSAWEDYQSVYEGRTVPALDHDTLIVGALLHDIGKLVEYERTIEGEYIKSKLGRELRHPFTGVVIAIRNGIPTEIAHTIANHAKEGDGTLRSPEGVIINKIDVMNFEIIKSFRGMV